MWRKQVGESSCNFRGNLRSNYTPLCQNMERKKCKLKVKLNYYWMNLYKIKSKDIVQFLICQFDLIMGQIKF